MSSNFISHPPCESGNRGSGNVEGPSRGVKRKCKMQSVVPTPSSACAAGVEVQAELACGGGEGPLTRGPFDRLFQRGKVRCMSVTLPTATADEGVGTTLMRLARRIRHKLWPPPAASIFSLQLGKRCPKIYLTYMLERVSGFRVIVYPPVSRGSGFGS